jgi:uncharacterized Rmd1/YagE family protein
VAGTTLSARALLLGERLDARGLERTGEALAGLVAIADPSDGHAFGFRWGALVTVGMADETTARLRHHLRLRVTDPLPHPVEETAAIRLDAGAEGPGKDGIVRLKEFSSVRLAVVAEALARSALLSHQEALVERTLDKLDPVLGRLRQGRLAPRVGVMLQAIGEAIAARSRAGARVDTGAKPDLLWDHPELAALYASLAEEWEIEERSEALSRKLEMIHETSETMLSLIDSRRSRVLELAVVLLIASELATTLYGLFRP